MYCFYQNIFSTYISKNYSARVITFFSFYSAVQAPKYDANATVDNDDDDDGY